MKPKYSGKDVNDKLMRAAGFVRDPKSDSPSFNTCGRITYWILKGHPFFPIITSKDHKISLPTLIERVISRERYIVCRRLRDKIGGVLAAETN
jgi:hypothetical protein